MVFEGGKDEEKSGGEEEAGVSRVEGGRGAGGRRKRRWQGKEDDI